jgi:hypothetical protein
MAQADDYGSCRWLWLRQMIMAQADDYGSGRWLWLRQMIMAHADDYGSGRWLWLMQMIMAHADDYGSGRWLWLRQMIMAQADDYSSGRCSSEWEEPTNHNAHQNISFPERAWLCVVPCAYCSIDGLLTQKPYQYRVIKKSLCTCLSCLTTWLNLTAWQPTAWARGTLDSH